jgi:DNA recombination protein RmuC
MPTAPELLAFLCALAAAAVAGYLLGRIRAAAAERDLAVGREALARVEAASAAIAAEKAVLVPEVAALRDRVTDLERRLATATEAASRVPLLESQAAEERATAAKLADEMTEMARQGADHAATIRAAAETRDRLQASLAAAEAALSGVSAALAEEQRKSAVLGETLDQERRTADQKLALLTEAREKMTAEFKLLAAEEMKARGETFARANQEQIDGLLNPLRLKIGEFQDGLRVANEQSIRERATLAEQIKALSEASGRMSTETLNLTRALKGEAQTQGAWGEMILSSILERSGLREGEEYLTQESHTGDEGNRLRPDVIVRLPNDQRVVIDSKVSLTAFEAHVAAETDEQRALALDRHVQSIRSHIRGLAGKKYQDASALDYVVMFVPIEGALALALQGDADITSHAVSNNVAIATPTTLMIALRTIANVWDVERRNRNADAIAQRAGLLYDKFVGFLDDMTTVGIRLRQASDAHSAAIGKLQSGSGNLIRQVDQLKALGARTGNKPIPAALLDAAAPDAREPLLPGVSAPT